MVLQDLNPGEELVLEAKWGGIEYELQSKVELIRKDYVLVNAFNYGGHIVDFGSSSFKGIIINVIAKNHDGKRYCWNDVNCELVNLYGKKYYRISTSGFKMIGKVKERRQDIRIKFDARCSVTILENGSTVNGVVSDISQKGIAVYIDDSNLKVGNLLEIEFADSVRRHEFDLRFKVRIVRKSTKGGKSLYGCKIIDATRESFGYIYLKMLDWQNPY